MASSHPGTAAHKQLKYLRSSARVWGGDPSCQILGQGEKEKSGMCFYLLSIPVKRNDLSPKHVLLLRPETVYIGLNPEWSM